MVKKIKAQAPRPFDKAEVEKRQRREAMANGIMAMIESEGMTVIEAISFLEQQIKPRILGTKVTRGGQKI